MSYSPAEIEDIVEALLILESVFGDDAENILDMFNGNYCDEQEVSAISEALTNETLRYDADDNK